MRKVAEFPLLAAQSTDTHAGWSLRQLDYPVVPADLLCRGLCSSGSLFCGHGIDSI